MARLPCYPPKVYTVATSKRQRRSNHAKSRSKSADKIKASTIADSLATDRARPARRSRALNDSSRVFVAGCNRNETVSLPTMSQLDTTYIALSLSIKH